LKLFFIVGTGRCGTQMLRNILRCWGDVRVLPETHFIVPLFKKYGKNEISVTDFLEVVDNIYSARGHRFVEGILLDGGLLASEYKASFEQYVRENQISGNIRDFTEAFFKFVYGGEFIFGDKTPHYGIHLDVIKELWPEAKVIHIYRNGFDVAKSMKNHIGFRKLIAKGIPPEQIDEYMYGDDFSKDCHSEISSDQALHYWKDAIEKTNESIEKYGENVISVKYEDLVFCPTQEIKRIAQYLEIHNQVNCLKKAICIPRPFPEKKQANAANNLLLDSKVDFVNETLNKYGYPYEFSRSRGVLGWCAELYRGRYSYFQFFKERLKGYARLLKRFA